MKKRTDGEILVEAVESQSLLVARGNLLNYWVQIEVYLPIYLKKSEILDQIFDYLEQGVFRLRESSEGVKMQILKDIKQFFLFCKLRGFLQKDMVNVFVKNLEKAQKSGAVDALAFEFKEQVGSIIEIPEEDDKWNELLVSNIVADYSRSVDCWLQEIEKGMNIEEERSILQANGERDALTGVLNRGEGGSRMLDLARRVKGGEFREPVEELMILMLDLDYFKNVNDTHGHIKGDKVLRSFAAFIDGYFSDLAVTYRYGGEEFCIALPVFAEQERKNLIEVFLGQMQQENFGLGKGNQTCSIGVSILKKEQLGGLNLEVRRKAGDEDQGVLDDFVGPADISLYKAKENGRNRAVIKEEGKFIDILPNGGKY